MDQWQGDKKGQCNGDEAAFHKWVLCAFGFWNTQYTRVGKKQTYRYKSMRDDKWIDES